MTEQASEATDLVETDLADIAQQPQAQALARRPAIELINEQQMQMLAAKSPGLTKGELAQGLELAFMYDLSPWANEVWFVKGRGRDGQPGKLLIMVGRDGMRKIAHRNGLEFASANVCEKDEFSVEYVQAEHDALPGEWEAHGRAPFHRVRHKQSGVGARRGAVLGAWSRVWDRATRRERGWFDAGREEYDQAGRDKYGPWNKQVSAMMLKAVERQAIGQATPLSGLLAEGEDQLINAGAPEQPQGDFLSGAPSEAMAEAVRDVVAAAQHRGHAGLGNWSTAEMALKGQPEEKWLAWVTRAREELERMPEPEPVDDEEHVEDAVVVDDEPDKPSPAEGDPAGLRAQALEALDGADAAEAAGDTAEADALREEAQRLNREADALEDDGQDAMEV